MKTTRITVETETLMIVRRVRVAPAWCPQCRAEVEAVRLDRDGLAEQASGEQLQDWLKTGKLHFWQAGDGTAQFCVVSLFQCLDLDAAQASVLSLKNPTITQGGNKDETQ